MKYPIETAPTNTVVLTNEGVAIYLKDELEHWKWYLCTTDGMIPSCVEEGRNISEVDPVTWMPMEDIFLGARNKNKWLNV